MLTDDFGQLLPPTTICYWHAAGLPELCEYDPIDSCPWIPGSFEEPATGAPSGAGGGRVKDLSEVSDLTSTGRKRAAMLYPIWPGMVCEWSGLARAGGGPDPIVGCRGNLIFPTKDGTAGNIHHGPDKSTLNNAPGNCHRICWSCHQLWHARNNRYYGKRPSGEVPYLPLSEYETFEHDPDSWAEPAALVAASVGRESVNPRVEDPTRRGVVAEDEWI